MVIVQHAVDRRIKTGKASVMVHSAPPQNGTATLSCSVSTKAEWNRNALGWSNIYPYLRMAGRPRSDSPQGQECLFSLLMCLYWLWGNPVSYPTNIGGVPFQGIKWPEWETDSSPVSSADIKNAWRCISAPLIYTRGVVPRYRDFTCSRPRRRDVPYTILVWKTFCKVAA